MEPGTPPNSTEPVPLAPPPPLDALPPQEMAARAELVGEKKASLDATSTLVLGILAGAFIALGALFSTTVVTGAAGVVPFGLTRLVAGLAFSLGLLLVVVGGAELFTGNTLIVMAWASGRISTARVLRNWGLVYLGNTVGAVGTAALVFLSGQWRFAGGAVGAMALSIAEKKLELGFWQALVLGILGNVLVCLAVWLTLSARSTTDRVLAVVPPVTAFVAAGFEHSIANLYFVPLALAIRAFAPEPFWAEIQATPADFPLLELPGFLAGNLLPVTLGNLIGGAGLVGAVYWFVYRRPAVRPRA